MGGAVPAGVVAAVADGGAVRGDVIAERSDGDAILTIWGRWTKRGGVLGGHIWQVTAGPAPAGHSWPSTSRSQLAPAPTGHS